MTILVTGSAGHLGEALMRTLRAGGQVALGVDIVQSPFTDAVGSICDPGFVTRCMPGVRAIIHAVTLHQPHVATHTNQDFVATNVSGTLTLLEAAVASGVRSFVFTSTTSAFGSALTPKQGDPAAWVTEDVVPTPKNIYGVTKVASEHLCELFHRKRGLSTIVLRTSRFFPEADDDAAIRKSYELANAQANEMLNRRIDIADVVSAHLLAIDRASEIGFGRYIVFATTPFARDELTELRTSAPAVVHRLFPECAEVFAARGWRLFPSIDRVYVNERAVAALAWRPKFDFRYVLECLRAGQDFRSPLARAIGC
jgi:UDP-glucose 4-epimerase